MKKLASGLVALILAGTMAIPPVSAHSVSFGFGVNLGPRVSYCDVYPWDCRPRFRSPRARISVDVGPFGFSLSGPRLRTHIARCEARYKSYVRETDSFFGFDGKWHRCRL